MIAWWWSCVTLRPLDGTAPCEEVGYAIARRTFECSGDADLANQRYEQFKDAYSCVSIDLQTKVDDFDGDTSSPADWFQCSFAVGELSCTLVDDYKDDFASWLQASPVCPEVTEPK